MKRMLAILLSVLMLMGVCASAAAEMAGMANPITEVDSLDAVNAAVKCNLCHPAVMGVTNEYFAVIGANGEYPVGEYRFELNGVSCIMRASGNMVDDISGVYVDGKPAFGYALLDDIEGVFTDDMKLARWFNLDGQYVLMVEDHGAMDEDTFAMFAGEMCDLTNNAMTESEYAAFYASLAGEWQDKTSQRAVAEIAANGSENVSIKVHWSSSAIETNVWTMTAFLLDDGALYYDDCRLTVVTTDEQGNTSEQVIYEDGVGYFVLADGDLLWLGAADENCAACVFEKM